MCPRVRPERLLDSPLVPPVLVMQHDADAGPGYLAEALAKAGLSVVLIDVAAGEPIPAGPWGGVVSLGGHMGAYEDDGYPWLTAERAVLAEAVRGGVPTLGICLGCQLLAAALGGRAYPGTGREIGSLQPVLTPAGRADPVVCHLDAPVPVSHADTWDLPPGGMLLAESRRYRQAFRWGSGLGLQPHVEVDPDSFARWVQDKPRAELVRDGVDPEAAIAAVRAGAHAQRAVAARLFGAWAFTVDRG